MSKRKYEKYILTKLKIPKEVLHRQKAYKKRATRILWMQDEFVEGADSVILSWYLKATEKEGTPSHVHDYDEILGFIGSDPKNPHDLGGEVEYWMEDEKYILKKSCLIWIPKGLRHCPLRVTRVDRPILFLAISMAKKYAKEGIIHAK